MLISSRKRLSLAVGGLATLAAFGLMCHATRIVGLAEQYPGLAGWVGAIGSILALIVFVAQNRTELRSRRTARNRRLDLFGNIVNDVEALLSTFLPIARVSYNQSLAEFALNKWSNEPLFAAVKDLDRLPVTDWVSKRAYDQFKIYWLNTAIVLNSALNAAINPQFSQRQLDELWMTAKLKIDARDAALPALRSALAEDRA